MASIRSVAGAASSWYFAAVFVFVLVFMVSSSEGNLVKSDSAVRGRRGCDEIYVVGEGETLHTISDKCEDPYIVEQNPQIQDSDVFPGLVIRITPIKSRKLLENN